MGGSVAEEMGPRLVSPQARGQGSPSRKGKGREKIDKSTEALEHIAAQLWGEAGKMDSAPGEGTSCCDEDSGFHPATRGAMRGPKQGHETPEAKKWSLCPRLFQKTFTHKHLPCL